MLTKEALKERRKGIGGSDAAKIVSGDWHALWLDKTGRNEPEDLSDVWAVQLGSHTESLNLDWYYRRTNNPVTRLGDVVIHPQHSFLRCTLDGFDAALNAVIQAKHVNAFAKIDEVRARYTPQVTHEMIVCGVERAVLSVIIGAAEPVRELIELDPLFAAEYVERCREFWHFVETDTPPPGAAVMEAPAAPAIMRTVDMTGNNEWATLAADWLATKGPAKTFKDAEKALKDMTEADVREAAGHGIAITRNKAGSLTIKESKK